MLWWTLRKIRSEDPHVRWLAAIRLGEIGHPKAVQALEAALGEEFTHIRLAAIQSLGRIGATRVLVAALDHSDNRVRKEAAMALGRNGSEDAVEALVRRLFDSADDVRHGAAQALQKLGWRPESDQDRAAFAVACRAWKEAEALGVVAVEALFVALRDDTLPDDERKRLIETLVNIGDALGRIGGPAAVETLAQMLQSLSLDGISVEAASGLAKRLFDLGDERALDWCLRHLGEARGWTLEIIVQAGGEETLRQLQELRADPDPYVARNALRALAMMGNQDAIGTLLSDMRYEDWAGHALTYFGTRNRILNIPPIGRGPDVEETVAALLDKIATNPDELPSAELERLLTLDLFEVWYLYDRDPDPDLRNRFEGIHPHDSTELRRVIGEELARRARVAADPSARPLPPTSN